MAVADVEVVVGTEDVAGDDGGKFAAVLLSVSSVHHVQHALGVAVAEVAVVGRSVVDHGFVDGVGGLVRKNAGGQTRDDLFDAKFVTEPQDVLVHFHVLGEEVEVGTHVVEQPSHHGGQMNDVGRPMLLENALGGRLVQQVGVFGRQEDPLLICALLLGRHDGFDTFTNQPGATGNHDHLETTF